MRLSFLYGRPLHEVMQWPASSVTFAREYLRREPAPEERIELAIAQVTAYYAIAHRRKGTVAKKIPEFLLFADAWKADEESEEEGSFEALAMSFGKVKRRGNDHR